MSEVTNPSSETDKASVDRARQEVGSLLSATHDSMRAIYADVGAASSRGELKKAFM